MKDVRWMTQHEIGDGGVLIVLVNFDDKTYRIRCPKEEGAVRLSIQKLSEFVRDERSRAAHEAYGRLH